MSSVNDEDRSSNFHPNNEKKEAIKKRKRVNHLYYEYDVSKREIARKEGVSRGFVQAWTESRDQDFTVDKRGRQKGDRHKWDTDTVMGIIEVREELQQDPSEPYWGPSAVQVEYRHAYPDREIPPVRTIGKILTDLGMTNNKREGVSKGALRYLRYPEYTIYNHLGNRVIEADFVGDKFISGRTEPLHFIGYSSKKEPRMRYFERVKGETADELIDTTDAFFVRFEVPDVLKVDNGPAMSGGGAHKRVISRTVKYLLEQKVIPVFSVPRRPATQASIEGSNSVFSRKFWNRKEFDDLQEVDEQLETFNEKTLKYLRYTPPGESSESEEEFQPNVYFTRQVRERKESGDEEGYIQVANDDVRLPIEYVKRFVLAEWNLRKEKLLVHLEEKRNPKENHPVGTEVIKEVEFGMHEKSKQNCKEILK